MAVTAKFQADFTSFHTAVQKAETDLVDFAKGAGKVESALNRMTDSFSGRKIIQDATLMVSAIERAGGTAVLTGNQLERAGAQAAEAAEKMKKLGIEVPPGLQKLADSTKVGTGFLADMGREIVKTAAGFVSANAVLGLARTAWTTVSGAISGAVSSASHLDDLNKSTHISISSLQELGFAGKRVGLSLDDIAGMASQLSKRLATGDQSAVAAVQSLGISLSALKALRPEDQFVKITEAVGRLSDPLDQAGIGSELFGRQFQGVLRLANDGLRETMDQAKAAGVVLSDDTVKALDAFGDKLGDIGERAKTLTTLALTPLIDALLKISNVGNQAKPPRFLDPEQQKLFEAFQKQLKESGLTAKSTAEQLGGLAGGLQVSEGAAASLMRSTTGLAKPLQVVGDAAKILDLNSGRLALSLEASKQKLEDQKKAASGAATEAKRLAAEIEKVAHLATLQPFDLGIDPADIPVIQDAGDAIMEVGRVLGVGKIAAQEFGRTVYDVSTGAITNMSDRLTVLDEGLSDGSRLMKQFRKEMAELPTTADKVYGALGNVDMILTNIGGTFAEVGSIAARTAKSIMDSLAKHDLWGAITAGVTGAIAGIQKLWSLFSRAESRRVNDLRDDFVSAAGGLGKLNEQARKAGQTLDTFLKVDTVKAYTAEIERLQKAFEFQDAALQQFDDTVKKYNLDIGDLGAAGATRLLGKEAKDLYTDFKVLEAGGVDAATSITGMQDALSQLVRDAIKSGVALPKQFEPIIKQMRDLGLLTDDVGDKFTDAELDGLSFGGTLTDEIDDLTSAIRALTDAISRGLGGAIRNLPSFPPIGDVGAPESPIPSLSPAAMGSQSARGGGRGSSDLERAMAVLAHRVALLPTDMVRALRDSSLASGVRV